MKKKLINWLCLSGVAGLIFYILHAVVGAMYYPGYDRMSQAMSDLTALSAPSFMVANGLASVYGLFSVLSSTLVCIVIQGKGNKVLRLGVYIFAAMNWVSGIGFALFPLSDSGFAGEFQDAMHLVTVFLVVGLSIISLILIIVGCLKKNYSKPLAIVATVVLVCMFIGGVGVNVVPLEYFGLMERFSLYGAVIFNAILGLYGFAFFDRVEARRIQKNNRNGIPI